MIDANANLLFKTDNVFNLYCPEKSHNKIIKIEINLVMVSEIGAKKHNAMSRF